MFYRFCTQEPLLLKWLGVRLNFLKKDNLAAYIRLYFAK